MGALGLMLLAAVAGSAFSQPQLAAQADPPYNPYPTPVNVSIPPEFILRNETLTVSLKRIATRDHEIIFTTMRCVSAFSSPPARCPPARPPTRVGLLWALAFCRFGDGDTNEVLSMVSNFCYFFHKHSLLRHVLLLTTDEPTWQSVHARGLPIYLDRVFPRHPAYIDSVKVGLSYNREFDVQKHWWGMRLVELGFRAMYSDSDSAFLQYPLAPFREAEWDVQGLSDWFEADQLPTGAAANRHCNLYKWVTDQRMPLGKMLGVSGWAGGWAWACNGWGLGVGRWWH